MTFACYTAARLLAEIYLMRHGRTALDVARRSDGWLDMPLSEEGQLSILPAQQRLKTVPLKTIYTPDLKRTRETAHLVASGTLSKPEVEEADDSKTWNLGALAGTKKRYGRPAVKRLVANPDSAPPGGESYNDFHARFLPWFEKVSKGAGPILIICSGSNLRCLGKELFDNEDSLDLDEGGLACLNRKNGAWHAHVICGSKQARVDTGVAKDDAMDGGKAAIDDVFDRGMT